MKGEAKDREEEDEATLPGFRFHPTDEELLGYYLRRKVENKPIKLELIKQIDIYKFDPWDLPSKSLYWITFFFYFISMNIGIVYCIMIIAQKIKWFVCFFFSFLK